MICGSSADKDGVKWELNRGYISGVIGRESGERYEWKVYLKPLDSQGLGGAIFQLDGSLVHHGSASRANHLCPVGSQLFQLLHGEAPDVDQIQLRQVSWSSEEEQNGLKFKVKKQPCGQKGPGAQR